MDTCKHDAKAHDWQLVLDASWTGYSIGGGTLLRKGLAIIDDTVVPFMRLLAHGLSVGLAIEAGECATAGFADLLAARRDTNRSKGVGFNRSWVIILD